MASRRPATRGRSDGRSRPGSRRAGAARGGSTSAAQPVWIIGAAAVVLVVVVLLLGSNSGDDAGGAANAGGAERQPEAAAERSVSGPAVTLGADRAGKPPGKTPPPLSQQTLQELSDLLAEAKRLVNEGKQARTGRGENLEARGLMSEATAVLAEWERKVSEPLRWQEDAQMEDWAQPAEYVALEQLYATFAKLQKEARMGGGTSR